LIGAAADSPFEIDGLCLRVNTRRLCAANDFNVMICENSSGRSSIYSGSTYPCKYSLLRSCPLQAYPEAVIGAEKQFVNLKWAGFYVKNYLLNSDI
jgi:hypothetical protein